MAVLVLLIGGVVVVDGLSEGRQVREVLNVSIVIGVLMLVGGSLLLAMSDHGKS